MSSNQLMSSEITNRIESLESKLQLEKKRYWKHMSLFLGMSCLILVVIIMISLVFIDSTAIIELQAANSSTTKSIDYLQFVVPILLTVGGFFLAFLGINRLKDIDAQVEKIRDNLHQELLAEKEQLSELRVEMFQNLQFEKTEMQKHRQALNDSIDQRIDIKTNGFRESIKDELAQEEEKLIRMLNECQKKGILDIESTSEHIITSMQEFSTQYGWLISSNKVNIESVLVSISSVYDAHQRIETLYASKPKPQNISEIVKHIVNEVTSNHIQGDDNDYHNLAAELARQNLYKESCLICEAGIYYFDNNVDLLSDWINYAAKIGDYNNVEKALEKLIKIPKNLWNWRAFDFTVDYYLAIGETEKADSLASEFIEWLPNEERAYNCQAEVYALKYGKQESTEKIIKVLQKALDLNLNCPMCANKLADILSECGKLEEALACANRAITELAQDQPSINYAFVFYRRAIICDRLFRLGLGVERSPILSEEALDYAVAAYNDYRTAINSQRLTYITSRQAETRMELISKCLPTEIVKKVNNNTQSVDLMKLLSQLPLQSLSIEDAE